MARRAQIMKSLGGGGTEAPRRRQIKEALGRGLKQPSGPGGQTEIPRRRPPGIGGGAVLPPPKRFPQFGNEPRQGSPLNAPVKLGGQLQGRVQSGAINRGQAQKTARQRQMLQKAFGSDWRKQVFGAGGAKGISGPFAQRQVAAKRAQGLARAKRKLY